jgi:hypothetical protein
MHVIKIYKLYMKIKILVLRFTMRGAIPPFHQYVFMVWYLGKHRDIFNNLTKFNETQVTVYRCTRVYTKVSGLSHNEGLWRQNSQNSDTTAPSDRELYHLQFSLQAANPETFGYTLVL